MIGMILKSKWLNIHYAQFIYSFYLFIYFCYSWDKGTVPSSLDDVYIGQGAIVSVMTIGEANELHVLGEVTAYFELNIKVFILHFHLFHNISHFYIFFRVKFLLSLQVSLLLIGG